MSLVRPLPVRSTTAGGGLFEERKEPMTAYEIRWPGKRWAVALSLDEARCLILKSFPDARLELHPESPERPLSWGTGSYNPGAVFRMIDGAIR